ncbi:MAG: Phytochrome, two-component sensor histidine kinase [uncultured Acetobacteraceae bacterium]|uniref:histidine kinase n=1 Tax=uncultured Acetobacteraceae bacterium TaxID=169975 RepID=A0A6J4JFV6_9PROT|nr:MAG: Phytochrome, two-component sensor histidine kinase [uncultured Acetobacteraceae bacterium]
MRTRLADPAPEPAPGGLDLGSCEREPIHLLGAVQGFGFLLAAGPDGTVRHASANAADHLGVPVEGAIGRPFSALLQREAMHEITGALQSLHGHHQTERLFGLSLVAGRPPYDVAVHMVPDGEGALTVVEAEPSAAEPRFDPVATVKGMMARLLSARTLEDMHERAARQLRAVLGFDRVMVYRFDEDGSGEVVGESVASHLEPYRGLRYPASDIPKQARALYCRNWLRLIADAGAEPVPVLSAPAPDAAASAPPDLSSSTLRSVSPVHVEYLRNMGVAASLSVSIMRGDELWGLLACHNSTPKVPSFQRRSAAELFGQLYSLQVESVERTQASRYEAEARAAHDRLLASVTEKDDVVGSLARVADELRVLVPCDGVAVCTGDRIETSGEAPDRQGMVELLHSLSDVSTSRVFAADSIAERHPPAARYADRAAGMLVIPISRAPRDYLIFFRKELVRTVVWAGDPSKVAEPGATRLHPRRSFEAWRETVRGRSTPWTAPELRAAESLRVTLLEVVVRLTGAAAEQRRASHERQELLIAELNHRVRNILALIRALVSRSQESAETLESFVGVLNGRIQSLARAHDQLTDDRWGPVALRGMFESEFRAYLGERQQERTRLSGPPVLIEPQALTVLALVTHELATNAAKYGGLSDHHGNVEVEWRFEEDGSLYLSWRESGGPVVVAPNRRGFGTTIIERSVPFELQGRAALRYAPTGLEAEFTIPARFVRAGEEKAVSAPKPRRSVEAPQLSGTALLVEDSTLLALDAEEILLKLGFDRVEVASTVAGGTAAVERAAGGFGFALLDFNLGDETSLPIAEELHRRGVPFAFATGYGKGIQLPPELAGTVPVIAKPYRADDIAKLVSRTLEKA